jgi:hypothetical protein
MQKVVGSNPISRFFLAEDGQDAYPRAMASFMAGSFECRLISDGDGFLPVGRAPRPSTRRAPEAS